MRGRLTKHKTIPLIAPRTTKLMHLGSSSDNRTNRWKLICPNCGQENIPLTTMLSTNTHQCISCNVMLFCNYSRDVESCTVMAR